MQTLNSPQRRWDCIRENCNTRGVNCGSLLNARGYQPINIHIYLFTLKKKKRKIDWTKEKSGKKKIKIRGIGPLWCSPYIAQCKKRHELLSSPLPRSCPTHPSAPIRVKESMSTNRCQSQALTNALPWWEPINAKDCQDRHTPKRRVCGHNHHLPPKKYKK